MKRNGGLQTEGRVWKFGDNVLNDGEITSVEMLRAHVFDPAKLAKSCMTGIDPKFPEKAAAGDVIIAGKNFGIGQNHITGPLAIKGLGLGVVTESMTRPFFRQAVAAGLRMLPFAPGISARFEQGDRVSVDYATGRIRNMTGDVIINVEPLPELILEFLKAGGEHEWLRKNYGRTA